MIDIVVISDIKIYRAGLGQILSGKGPIRVMDSSNTCEAAIASISSISPQVVLLDMSTADSCKIAQQISQIRPQTKIVALAVAYNEQSIIRYAEAGITCYVPREASVDELVEAVVCAANGDCYCPPKIAAFILKNVRGSGSTNQDQSQRRAMINQEPLDQNACYFSCLTQRERQVVGFLSEGLSNKQIANKLSIEISTVKNHVHNLLVKLNVKNRGQAAFLLQRLTPGLYNIAKDLERSLALSTPELAAIQPKSGSTPH